jgi:hypothetical protein
MSFIAEIDLDGDDATEEDAEEADGGHDQDTHSEVAEGDLVTVTANLSSVAVDPDTGKKSAAEESVSGKVDWQAIANDQPGCKSLLFFIFSP